jgi:hypothetical protein
MPTRAIESIWSESGAHRIPDELKVRLEGFEPPTLGFEDCSGVLVDVSQCPSLQVKFEMESAFVRLRAPMFWSFIPIS